MGEELYVQLVFCTVNFRRSIYAAYRVVSGIIRKPVKLKISNCFFNFVFFLRSYEGLKCAERQPNFC